MSLSKIIGKAIAKNKINKDPSIKEDILKIKKNMADLEEESEKKLKEIANKYKGTEWEEYFNY